MRIIFSLFCHENIWNTCIFLRYNPQFSDTSAFAEELKAKMNHFRSEGKKRLADLTMNARCGWTNTELGEWWRSSVLVSSGWIEVQNLQNSSEPIHLSYRVCAPIVDTPLICEVRVSLTIAFRILHRNHCPKHPAKSSSWVIPAKIVSRDRHCQLRCLDWTFFCWDTGKPHPQRSKRATGLSTK